MEKKVVVRLIKISLQNNNSLIKSNELSSKFNLNTVGNPLYLYYLFIILSDFTEYR
jgi:hypothetical protein